MKNWRIESMPYSSRRAILTGLSGYAVYRYYYFFADSGSLWIGIDKIDSNSVYCAMTVYNYWAGEPIASSEGGAPGINLNTTLPALDWYFVIIVTYGCGPWDDQQIRVMITHDSPDYDLQVSRFDIIPHVEDAHPDTGASVYFVIDDVGEAPIPYEDIDQSQYFIPSCECEYEYAYPVSFSVYAGKDIQCDSTTGLQYSCFQDTVYLGGEYSLTTSCPDTIKAPYSACSKIWNILARVDPANLFHETNEQNNCSLVAQIGWAHHINGHLQGFDWNAGADVSRGINGMPVYAHVFPGPYSYEAITRQQGSQPGYFEFWTPYSILRDYFYLSAYLDKQSFAMVYDSSTSNPAYMESGDYNEPAYFSSPIVFAPYWYSRDRTKDTIFNTGANGIFGIEDFNSFISGRLGHPYALPYLQFSIGNQYNCFGGEGGIPLIRLGKNIDTSLYYDRRVMHELAHAVYYDMVEEMGAEHPGCGIHGPGMFPEYEICAFIEGSAGFLQAIVPSTNAWTFISQECGRFDFACLDSNNIEHNDWLDDYITGEGQNEEGAVATVLYDLYDTYSPYGGDDGDPLRESFTDIYSAMGATYDPISILQYANRHMSDAMAGDADGATRIARFCQLLSQNKVDVSQLIYCGEYVCGDANGDWVINVGDAVYVVNYIFKGGPIPPNLDAADATCDGRISVGDAVYVIAYIFRHGPAPCCPDKAGIKTGEVE
ncbi:MAG: dockerin type I repeat-containing protein [candidate division Zixibacteria bacterium]|nr:dockerin type I repeat-containing protein [candidate division Zixibacteria bacterium]